MQTLLERGNVQGNVYITLVYTVDANNIVACEALNESQLAAFSDYIHEFLSYETSGYGNSLREATPEEVRLWNIFCETLLVCATCASKPVTFNPFSQEWVCDEHATGLEE